MYGAYNSDPKASPLFLEGENQADVFGQLQFSLQKCKQAARVALISHNFQSCPLVLLVLRAEAYSQRLPKNTLGKKLGGLCLTAMGSGLEQLPADLADGFEISKLTVTPPVSSKPSM